MPLIFPEMTDEPISQVVILHVSIPHPHLLSVKQLNGGSDMLHFLHGCVRNGSLIVEHNVLFDIVSKNEERAFHAHLQNAEDIVQKRLADINTTQSNCSESTCCAITWLRKER